MSFTDRVISLCETAPGERSEEDIEFVAKWIGSSSSYFRKLRNKDAIREVVRDCHLQRYRCNEMIIRQGEKGDTFYLIITGRVSVYVNNDRDQVSVEANATTVGDQATDRGRQVRTAAQDPDEDSGAVQRDQAGDAEEDVDVAFREADASLDRAGGDSSEGMRSRLLGARVLEMGEGYAFGEIALTSPNSIRKASVVCDEDAAVLVIHQESFARTLKAYQLQEFQMIEAFIDACPVFANWRPKQRQSLRNSLQREVYGFGEPILQQGQQSGGLFFIVKGSVKLLADPTKWPASVQKNSDKEDAADSTASATKGVPAPATVQAGLLRHRQGYRAAEQRARHRQIEIALLGEGEILGQVELLASFGESLTTAISTDQTYGYWLNRANCRRLLARNRLALAQLRQTILLRLQSRSQRAPLMRRLGQDPRVAGGVAAAAAAVAAAAAASTDPVTAGEQQRQVQEQQRQTSLMHTRKQPPSADLLWQNMLAMYVEGRGELGPAPADASLYYRHLCRVNAERRRHHRERSRPARLVAPRPGEADAEDAEADGRQSQSQALQPQRQPPRRTVPRSIRLLKRELEASGDGSIAGLDLRQPTVEDANRAAFRPASTAKSPDGAATAASAPSSAAIANPASSSSVPRLLADFELSRVHLRGLERRIEAFFSDTAGLVSGNGRGSPSIGTSNSKGHKPHVEPLRLLPDIEVQKRRLRGSRVLVKTKQCPASGANGQQVLGHSHVTNHVVSSLPDWDQKVLRTRREKLRQLEQMSSA